MEWHTIKCLHGVTRAVCILYAATITVKFMLCGAMVWTVWCVACGAVPEGFTCGLVKSVLLLIAISCVYNIAGTVWTMELCIYIAR